MRQIQTDREDRFVLATTLDGGTLYGGCAMVAAGGIPVLSETIRDYAPGYLLGWWGAGLLACGLLLLVYRRGAVVDRAERTVERWWGLGHLPVFWRTQPLTAHTVEISKLTHVNGEGADTIRYPVALLGNGQRAVLVTGHSATNSWALAQLLADFLGVTLADKTEQDVRTMNPFRS